jgi:hypothetical protein
MAVYDQMAIRIDGKLLIENTKIDLSLDGTDTDVFTIIQNTLAGQTPGPKKVVGKLDNVVPPTGFEFDAWAAMNASTEHVVQYIQMSSGKSLTSTGTFIRAVSLSSGVGQTQAFNFECHGKTANWQ